MEIQRNSSDMINFMVCPGFCVRDHKITHVNDAASRLFLTPGQELAPLLVTGREELEALREGCLYLTLQLAGRNRGAVAAAVSDFLVFLVDDERELQELQVLALAAQELRTPLSNIMISAGRIHPGQEDTASLEHQDRLNRGTSQMLRLISNMSDALRYTEGCNPETRNITALLAEIFQKAGLLAAEAGVHLSYSGPQEDIFTQADGEQLERAVYNLLSNSLKFTPRGGKIEVIARKQRQILRLSVQDSGGGIAEGVLQNIFSRYLRVPSLEDSRFGLGLGMVLVRAAAANHGGTVLIDQPSQGTRVTLTLAIRENIQTVLRSPMLRVDYAGERDHGLLELSESLPAALYHDQE